MKRAMCAMFVLCCVSECTLRGSSITIGTFNNNNLFPFGGPTSFGNPATRYQEAYASGDFSGPISITGIDFFPAPGFSSSLYSLYSGTYQLSLSTITADINTLSDSNFAGNLGLDNSVFDTVALSGPAPSPLTFTGGPFNYDPSQGNLLLDIQITGASGAPLLSIPTGAAFEDVGPGGPSGIVRYQNFGSGTTGFGLVTEFDSSTGVPEPGTLSLLGCGLVGFLVQRLRR
jgi:hypothetical protein